MTEPTPLDDLVTAAVSERERSFAAAQPTEAMHRETVRRVRRRHVVRATAQAGTALAVAVVLGGAAWWGARPEPAPPAHTPTPAPSATAPATSTPSASPTSSAATQVDDRVVVPGLAAPLPRATPGLLASTTPGWALVRWSESDDSPSVLLLASPTADLYWVAGAPQDAPFWLGSWQAGATVVKGTTWDGDATYAPASVDLLTGRMTTGPAFPPGSTVVGFSAAGEWVLLVVDPEIDRAHAGYVGRVVLADGAGGLREITRAAPVASTASVSPDGRRVIVPDHRGIEGFVFDLVDGSHQRVVPSVPYAPRCTTGTWLDDTAAVTVCEPAGVGAQAEATSVHVFQVGTNARVAQYVPGAGGLVPTPYQPLVGLDGVLAFSDPTSGTCLGGSLVLLDPRTGTTTHVTVDGRLVDATVVSRGGGFLWTREACADHEVPSSLVRIDPASGEARQLVPVPADVVGMVDAVPATAR
ncbi:hypothetical protein OMK64_15215 [Cellulomonas fimi]|uniref:hypothetical protein n=1 Tax=Cellulomonas fimi TaxID=1708 RepID=UPI00234C1560|nr:hypothetical protein [Cellulomonas fimi]MDC7122884.1 hypothetical protein [Cellulomonas fimi]